MTSVALLGDSIFDNKVYVAAGPDVAAQLREVLHRADDPWRVTLCAVDGTMTQDVGKQLARVPDHVTHIVLPLGGNEGRRAVTALGLFNDVIVRAALARGVDVLDLRSVCTEPGDYANEIEPGVRGGEKIARAIAQAVGAQEAKSGIRVHAGMD